MNRDLQNKADHRLRRLVSLTKHAFNVRTLWVRERKCFRNDWPKKHKGKPRECCIYLRSGPNPYHLKQKGDCLFLSGTKNITILTLQWELATGNRAPRWGSWHIPVLRWLDAIRRFPYSWWAGWWTCAEKGIHPDCDMLVAKSWVLGNKYLCGVYCNATMEHFINCFRYDIVDPQTVQYVLQNTLPDSKLRQAVMDQIQAMGPFHEDFAGDLKREAWKKYISNASTDPEKETIKACLMAGGLHNFNRNSFGREDADFSKYMVEGSSTSDGDEWWARGWTWTERGRWLVGDQSIHGLWQLGRVRI